MLYSEQCQPLVSGTYRTSCKTGEGVDEMFKDIAQQLIESNRSRIELERLTEDSGFRVVYTEDSGNSNGCSC